MNAVIRAVVRTGIHYGMEVFGVKRGYDGLINNDIIPMTASRVSDIIHRGGTILRTARCPEMLTKGGRKIAADVVREMKMDALIIAGGDGSFKGAQSLSQLGVNVMAIPATIDLDMDCTEYTIGFDTAVNTGIEAINRIRDTSYSHERCSVVEVMGRDAGYLALWCGLCGGAEEVLTPELNNMDAEMVLQEIRKNRSRGKHHNLIVVAEGVGGSVNLAKEIDKEEGIESRATILGHLQRGGMPTALDRMHASKMGFLAVNAIKNGEANKAVVFRGGSHMLIDLNEALACKKETNPEMYEIIKILAI
jgi:6-phosphofructokinase 1